MDWIFYLGTPILVIPVVVFYSDTNASLKLAFFTASFLGLGHHFPSFLRAYGDRLLFKKYKWRFIIAPLVLIPLAGLYTFYDIKAYYFLILLWIAWHSASQIFGIGRMYDSKIGKIDSLTARLDWMLILAWFYCVIILSPWRLGGYMAVFYQTGGPFLSASNILFLQNSAKIFLGLFTLLYLLHYFAKRSIFPLKNHLKLALFITNIAMWYYAFVEVKNVIVGLCIWEIIHWAQITPLTWTYNHNRSQRHPEIGNFIKTIFSQKKMWIFIYTALVLSYGALGTIPHLLEDDFYYRLITALLVSSGILHFYYEGFVWKVRDTDIQEGMELSLGKANPTHLFKSPQLKHAFMWSLFFIPLAALTYSHFHSNRDNLEIYQKIIEANPKCWYSQYNVAVELEDRGDFANAAIHYQNSININPRYTDSRNHLAKILIDQGNYDLAISHLQAALDFDSENYLTLNYLGNAHFKKGNVVAARDYYEKSLKLHPDNPEALNNMGFSFLQEKNLNQARVLFEKALKLAPNYSPAQINFAQLLIFENDYNKAYSELQNVLQNYPGDPLATDGMVFILTSHPDSSKRDFAQADSLKALASNSIQHQDPNKIKAEYKRIGNIRRPENTKIL